MESRIEDSPETILYYALTISRKKGCHVGARVIKRLARSLGESNEIYPIKEYYAYLDLAYKHTIKSGLP